MDIGNYIKLCLKKKGLKIKWLCEKLNQYFYVENIQNSIESKTLYTKLGNNSLSANELIQIAIILDINLESLKGFVDKTYFNEDIYLSKKKDEIVKLSDFVDETSTFDILKIEDEKETYVLMSLNIIKDYATLEVFDLENDEKIVFGKIQEFQEQLLYQDTSICKFNELCPIKKYQFLTDYFKTYYALYPGKKCVDKKVKLIKD